MRKNMLIWISFTSISIGILIYFLDSLNLGLPAVIRNYLPDALWAISFSASICWLWFDDFKLGTIWYFVCLGSMISFEFLQYIQIIKGTSDFIDIIVYFFFSLTVYLLSYKTIFLKTKP